MTKVPPEDITTDEVAATDPSPLDPPDGGDAARASDDEALAKLTRERDDLKDQLLRRAADFDNFRKRVERERRDVAEQGVQEVLLGLLPIIDDFERAIAAEIPAEAEGYRAGIELIYKQLQDLLRKHGATPIQAVGTDFDPHFHEAVVHETSGTHRDGEVMEEFQRGYRLGDRLLRAAMVKVAKRESA